MRGVTADTQTWLAARGYLLARSDDFFLRLTRAREAFAAEPIHDLRVSARRLREGISLFAHCFRKRQFAPLRRELKVLTDMLGSIRNTDEALLFFSPLAGQCEAEATAAVTTILATLKDAREEEERKLKGELKNIDSGALRGRIDDICGNPRIFNPNATGLFRPIADYLLESVAVREKSMLELLPDAIVEENVAAQHRLRIAVKRFRYRMEFLAPLAQGDYKGVYATVKEYQEVLGHLHDLDVFGGLCGEMPIDGEGAHLVQHIISDRRRKLYAGFVQLHGTHPLDELGNRVRGLL